MLFVLKFMIVRMRNERMKSSVYNLLFNQFWENGKGMYFEFHDCKGAR